MPNTEHSPLIIYILGLHSIPSLCAPNARLSVFCCFFFCFRSIKIISTVAVGSMQLLGLLNNNTIVIYKSFIIFSCFAAHLSRSFIGQERRASLLVNLIKNFSDESLRNCNYLKNDLEPLTINRCTF